VYTGQHKGCLPEGQGEYTYPNGEKYAGGWAAGKKHGTGVYYYTDGSVLRGEWAAGVQHGDAKWEHCTAYMAQGAFDAGVPAQRCVVVVLGCVWVWVCVLQLCSSFPCSTTVLYARQTRS